jgi:hypothetical protein
LGTHADPTPADPNCVPRPAAPAVVLAPGPAPAAAPTPSSEGASGSGSASSGYNGKPTGPGGLFVTVPTENGGDMLVPTDEVTYAPAPAPALSASEQAAYLAQLSQDFVQNDQHFWQQARARGSRHACTA